MRCKDAKPCGCALAAIVMMLCSSGLLRAGEAERTSPVAMIDSSLSTSTVRPTVSLREPSQHRAADSDRETARSDNFRVTAPAGDDLAQRVLEAAECYRREIAIEWLGRELEPGPDVILIHVDLCEDRDVGLAVLGGDRAKRCRRIWLRTSADRALGTTLAHEIAHAVLAEQIPIAMPVWATEGVACQYDDRARKIIRAEIVGRFVRTNHWPSLRELLESLSISPTDEVAYATSVSLTNFLIVLGGRREFVEFVAAGRFGDWDTALADHYGLQDIDQLRQEWHDWVMARGTALPQSTANEGWYAIATPTEQSTASQ